MNAKATNIKQRLSLRQPLQEALDILVTLAEKLELKKEVDLITELEKVQSLFPTCTDFEREFPSICFSIATGVGKTRLMGAFIAYLYLQKGIRNFFILAPNLTIYDKLIEDFGNPSYQKYVFSGIAEFVHNRPVVITGDNYNQTSNLFSDAEIRINIFNIAKFNSDNKTTKKDGQVLAPRIKRLSEYLGQSYWNYLSNLTDLVILMDEAHRYHADASKKAINELKPILGLELTATPIDEKGNAFKNVVYEYSLAQALADGKYVKSPAIATRKDFKPAGLSDKEIELIKLEDAISIHEDTRNELEIYARNAGAKLVKPFVLVVCKDIAHAREVYDYINSDQFYEGQYKGKVLQIDSSTKSEDQIEKQFLTLEQTSNEIEIVIHVNMLKEGWDVTNLYTIVPLRAANASVLIEQTLGRGLRLPYNGERTGVDKVDKLTVVAHENFEKVITAAQDTNSILNKIKFIQIDEAELKAKTVVVSSLPKTEENFKAEQQEIEKITQPAQKQKAQNTLDAKKAIIQVLPSFNAAEGVKKVDDLAKPEVKALVIEKVKQELNKGQLNVFAANIIEEAEAVYEKLLVEYKNNIIEIPRMDLVQDEVSAWFEDFDLNTASFNYELLEKEIFRVGLKDQQVDSIKLHTGIKYGNPVRTLVSELINFPEIDYDSTSDLLFKLAQQAVAALETTITDPKKLAELVSDFKKPISTKMYEQMREHFRMSEPTYLEPKVLPFVKIENWNFSTLANAGTRDYRDQIQPASAIPKYVCRGFEKACHVEYKFDSKTEKDFAYILEHEKAVLKWMRPAPNQFRIYWANNSSRYQPDFVVETEDAIYLIETKAAEQVSSAEVQDKKKAALQYCKHATNFTKANGGKPWYYILIPHTEVNLNTSFNHLKNQFQQA
ncbi:MAG: restriction endonuclease subunit R [Cytophagales bacterium CG18_big_fil_WC_8_21_14_2_50_42_9]|nr:MAG: restriction endonuclease subunit R [Cytophagales bacterium CG18_big_fil_WC_8_21_14_2_50_42_9]